MVRSRLVSAIFVVLFAAGQYPLRLEAQDGVIFACVQSNNGGLRRCRPTRPKPNG